MKKPNQKKDTPKSVYYDWQVLNKSHGKKSLNNGIAEIGKRNTWKGREKIASPWWTLGKKCGGL
ncbi:MAG TPA: hypothetical protein EYQ84_01750 [Nitrospinaceae bacterium]|nr:hypothetical protein [Nitrospinaceae bacterium]